MTPELTVAVLSLVLNACVVPAVIAQVRLNWNHERRLTRLETHAGFAPQEN